MTYIHLFIILAKEIIPILDRETLGGGIIIEKTIEIKWVLYYLDSSMDMCSLKLHMLIFFPLLKNIYNEGMQGYRGLEWEDPSEIWSDVTFSFVNFGIV